MQTLHYHVRPLGGDVSDSSVLLGCYFFSVTSGGQTGLSRESVSARGIVQIEWQGSVAVTTGLG